jgi:hypothetical protein
MSSEFLASGQNVLDSNLGGAWDITNGYAGRKQDLGIARRFGGSAAAYSLRDIGAMNGPVVRVRREPNDTTAGIDDEENFSASQVASGVLEDWVNGKLENTLPADVATASAAFSLRKVKASYTDDAVRIRRSSDSVEVDVAFDSDDKVSSSSAVTNVAEQGGESGQTSATTLGGFLTETANMYTSNFASTDGFIGGQGAVASADGIGGKDDVLGFTLNTSASQFHMAFKNIGTSDETVRVQGEIYIPSSNNKVDSVAIFIDGGGSTSQIGSTLVPTADQWVAFDVTGQVSGTKIHFRAKDGGTFTIEDTGGDDVFYLANVTVDATQSSAFVHTWYDQTDNNDAIQETADNQPKIAENGSLLDHINFDGNTFLNIGANLMDGTDGTTSMVMSNIDIDIQTFYISNRGGANGFNFFNDTGSGEKGKFKYAFVGSGSSLTSNTFVSDNSDDKFLVTFTKDSNDREFFGNGAALADDGASNTYTSAGGTNTSIGKQGNSSTASTSKLMRVYEIISYNSDETDNRFKIESNINNYWGLYNDGNDTSDTEWQFHNTETGTSANGTDGYVFKNSDADVGIASLELKDGVVSGDIIYYSFFYDRTTGSPTVRLASDETDSGSSVSNDDAVGTNTGFISGTLTATGTGSFFMIADNDNPSDFTISNFRMSRIARNGLVETWYDQSSNGNDATQGTATNQPAIVENGGLVTVNSKPAIKFDGTDNYFIMDSEVKFNSSDSDKANTILNVAYIVSGNRAYMGLGAGTNNWFGVPYIDNYRYRDNAGNIINTGDAVPLNQQISFTFVSDESNDIETYQNGTSIHSDNSTFTTHLRIKNIGRSYNGANYNEMSSQEIVFFADDKTSDITDLHNEINNYYGI